MLEKNEERLIKIMYVIPQVIVFLILSIILSFITSILCEMVHGVFYNGAGVGSLLWYEVSGFTFNLIMILVTILAVVCFGGITIILFQKEKLQKIINNVNELENRIDVANSMHMKLSSVAFGIYLNIAFYLMKESKRIMNKFNIKKPKIVFLLILITLFPSFIVYRAYSPIFDYATNVAAESKELAGETFDKMVNLFENNLDEVFTPSYSSPEKEYNKNGYKVSGRYSNEMSYSEITVIIDNEGKIKAVEYSCNVDENNSQEENIKIAESNFKKIYDLLMNGDFEFTDERLKNKPEFPNNFKNEYLSNNKEEATTKSDYSEDFTKSFDYHYYENSTSYKSHFDITFRVEFVLKK